MCVNVSAFWQRHCLFLECGADEYTCQDKTCIPARAVCDRGCDCLGSCEDENGHGEFNCQCRLHPP